MVITAQRQGETVRDYACRIIKENIVTMELKPGSLVSETELAKELGVSRTPVREALIQLGKNGMVETFPQRGTKVSLIDTDSVNESRFYRLVIEKALVQEYVIIVMKMIYFHKTKIYISSCFALKLKMFIKLLRQIMNFINYFL